MEIIVGCFLFAENNCKRRSYAKLTFDSKSRTDDSTNFERVSDHCSNIAIGLIDESEHTMNAHEAVKAIKENDAHYSEKCAEYSSKYAIS